MKRLFPNSLSGRVILAIVSGALAIQIMAAVLFHQDQAGFKDYVTGDLAAQRLANIVSALNIVDGRERERFVQALSVSPHRFSLDLSWSTNVEEPLPEAAEFRRRIQQNLDTPLAVQILAMRHVDQPALADRFRRFLKHGLQPGSDHDGTAIRPGQHGQVFAIDGQVRFSNGAVLTFQRTMPYRISELSNRLWYLLVLWSVGITLLVSWSVFRILQPLKVLSSAALGFAANLHQAPLSEHGPLEVQQAAAAFNTMQQQLACLIETRAQALTGISHDLRLPLTRMRLRIEDIDDAGLREKMERDLLDMDQMVAGTLAFLRANTVTEAQIQTDLYALIDGVADDMRDMGAQVDVRGTLDRPVMVYPQAIRRCLANLLDNARVHAAGTIVVQIEPDEESVCIHVDDHGPGIPVALRERVFEPYIRLDPARSSNTGGSGLGLAIARAIARTHGGEVSICDDRTVGLRITLQLPLGAAYAH